MRLYLVLASLASVALSACGSADSSPQDPPAEQVPTAIRYSTVNAVYTVGKPIPANVPTYQGGAPSVWTIRPALLPGLALDPKTGVISGTPTSVLIGVASYTVFASNSAGSASAKLTLSVNEAPPSALSYSTADAVYALWVPVGISPRYSGRVDLFSVSPALPAGLVLNSRTGFISGTPTAVAETATYVVTATNSGGSTTATLTIGVKELHSTLSYHLGFADYQLGVPIEPLTPTVWGASLSGYSVNPQLPPGLQLDPLTGIISGTPTAPFPTTTTYTVTGVGELGPASDTFSMRVRDIAPSGLSYATNWPVYIRGHAIDANVPTHQGGAVASYSVSPSLPPGLTLDPTTGVISGTPSEVRALSDYGVTATNSGGTATVTLVIEVRDEAPSALTYSTNPAVYTWEQTIAPNTPSNSGGVPTAYSVSPPLPRGLILDAKTGVISGTPFQGTPEATYTVTAANVTGSTSAELVITVNDVAPTALRYSANPAVYRIGQYAYDSEHHDGGVISSCSITPALPDGLSLGTYCDIFGTPTRITDAAVYTVTGTNPAGATSAQLQLTVTDIPPTQLAYSTSLDLYTLGQPIPPNAPTHQGGAVASYSVSPVLPEGLSLDATTGTISGIPTEVTATVRYTVTATNTGGSTTVPVIFGVQPVESDRTQGILAAGGNETCAVVSGRLKCWGQLGDDSQSNSTVPLEVEGLGASVEGVAIGAGSSCAVVNGAAWCWGRNDGGQLGNGSFKDSALPVQVSGLSSGVQAVAVGDHHACALVNGGVQCWGANDHGQLGMGAPLATRTPVQVLGLTSGVQAISAGGDRTCALVNGGVWCWGDNARGQLGDGTAEDRPAPVQVVGLTSGVQAIANGQSHVCALINGGAQCWGSNASGRLGNGSSYDSTVPVQVQGLTAGVQALAAGGDHTCAIVHGSAWCWGGNGHGQSGAEAGTYSATPVQVPELSSGVQAIAAGAEHSCALVNGAAKCWGLDAAGQLGDASVDDRVAPVQVQGLAYGLGSLVSGDNHSCMESNGGVLCWGWNESLEGGQDQWAISVVPLQVQGLASGVQSLAAGLTHTCAVVNGGAQCWGSYDSGQLGNDRGGYDNRTARPVQVIGLTEGVQSIAAGDHHTCALVNGGVWCWGDNSEGQLGGLRVPSTRNYFPEPVPSLTSGVQAIAASGDTTCALVNGGVQCWGKNDSGGLGALVGARSYVPVAVTGLSTGVQALAAGGKLNCARVDGGVKCWGTNLNGQLGAQLPPYQNASSTPVQVQGLEGGVQGIAASRSNACAVVGGGLQCWGLYNGLENVSRVPVQIDGLGSGARSISVGYAFTCALVDSGIRCWGLNNHGQLGNGTVTQTTIGQPVEVFGF